MTKSSHTFHKTDDGWQKGQLQCITEAIPDGPEEVAGWREAEPLLPRVVGRREVPLKLLLGHDLLHLLVHAALDQPLGVPGEPVAGKNSRSWLMLR